MKIRPNHGLGILLALIIIALIATASSGPDTDVGSTYDFDNVNSPQQAPVAIAESYVGREDYERDINPADQQAAAEMMAGVIGMMMLNQLAQSAQQYDDGYTQNPGNDGYGGYYDQGENFEYSGRWGSGSQYSDGSWNHYSDAAGGAVGGTSDGCIYTTFGWSNC